MKLSRRDVLRALAAGAAGAAGSALLPSAVFADPRARPPKRFVCFFTANGFRHAAWRPRNVVSETEWQFSQILAPLEPFRRKLLILDGLDMSASYEGPGGEHQRAMGALLTGRPLNEGDMPGDVGTDSAGWGSGISIDQEMASRLGRTTCFRSLELGVRIEGSNNRHRIAYAGNDQPLPPCDNPYEVFGRVFGAGADALPATRARRTSVLDFARHELARIGAELRGDERMRVDAHLESIRDIERRLAAPIATGAAVAACQPPQMGARRNVSLMGHLGTMGGLQMDLLVTALACDLTRFATLIWGGATSNAPFTFLGIDEGHHVLSHRGPGDTVAQNALVAIQSWYAQQFARFLGRLDSVREGDGTLLDNTLVLWASEVAVGNTHDRHNMMYVIAGGAGGALRTGRYLRLTGRKHNDLLVAISHAMDHPITTFGSPAHCTGVLGGLLA